ncbi:MAG: TetR family transcriptional regulator [Ilumatobacteraceae bacterium]
MTAAGLIDEPLDREAAILDAALVVLARHGIGGVTMRAVAHAAGVSLGLANYYFTDKTSLISAALRRIGEQDLDIVRADGGTPADRLRRALRRVGDDELIRPQYMALRLQLWSLATVDRAFSEINRSAQRRYLDKLADLIAAAMPDLDHDEVARRAGDILVVQNGIWLTAALIDDREALDRSIERCEKIAFATTTSIARRHTRPTVSSAR